METPEQKHQATAEEKLVEIQALFDNEIKTAGVSQLSNNINNFASKVQMFKSFASPDNSRVQELIDKVAEFKDRSEKEGKRRQMVTQVPQFINSFAFSIPSIINNNGIYKDKTYSEYLELKDTYRNECEENEYAEKNIQLLDDYYDNYLPNVFVQAYKEKQLSEDCFDENNWRQIPDYVIKTIEKHIEKDIPASQFPAYMKPEHGGLIKEMSALYTDQKARVEEYMNNGEFAKQQAAAKEKVAAEVSAEIESPPRVSRYIFSGSSREDHSITYNIDNDGYVYKGMSNEYASSVVCCLYDGRVYKGTSQYNSDVICTIAEDGAVYRGTSDYASDILFHFHENGMAAYRKTSIHSSDIIFRYDKDGYVYNGNSDYASDVIFNIDGEFTKVEIVALWVAIQGV